MVRWYDCFASMAFAYVMFICFWVPAIGPLASFLVYEVWTDVYCKYRKISEEKFL